MFNAYAIIIGLFILGGLITTAWGVSLIARTRAMRRWPRVDGVIETSDPAGQTDDLLPHSVFSYTLHGKTYRRTVEFPAGTLPTPEINAAWLGKYPVGSKVTVYYDPQRPDNSSLEPARGAGDWLIFALGLCAALLGITMLLI